MDDVPRAYAARAAEYIGLLGRTAVVDAADLDLIERHLLRPGGVLDVGCGPGHLTAHLRSRGVDATGLDLVPEFADHARAAHPDGRYVLGSMDRLPFDDGSVAGLLAWYSLIHLRPEDLDGVLAELRRTTATGGTLVVGFFDGDVVEPFDHTVVTAYRWPIDELAMRLRRAGFQEVERQQRPGVDEPGRRPHAAIVATAVDGDREQFSSTNACNLFDIDVEPASVSR